MQQEIRGERLGAPEHDRLLRAAHRLPLDRRVGHRLVRLWNRERDLIRELERGLVPAREREPRVARFELREAIGLTPALQAVEARRALVELVREVDLEGVGARFDLGRRDRGDESLLAFLNLECPFPGFPFEDHLGELHLLRVKLNRGRRLGHREIDPSRARVVHLRGIEVQVDGLERGLDVGRKPAGRSLGERGRRDKAAEDEQDHRDSGCGRSGHGVSVRRLGRWIAGGHRQSEYLIRLIRNDVSVKMRATWDGVRECGRRLPFVHVRARQDQHPQQTCRTQTWPTTMPNWRTQGHVPDQVNR